MSIDPSFVRRAVLHSPTPVAAPAELDAEAPSGHAAPTAARDLFAAANAPLHELRSQGQALDELVQTRATRSAARTMPTLERGAHGAAVEELQRLLTQAGFSPGAIDGDFGPKTDAAVRSFQRANGLVVDGEVGPKTWAALQGVDPQPAPGPVTPAPVTPTPSPGAGTPTLERGAHGPAVQELQQLLTQAGFSPGAIDGDFGPKTDAAVRSFQRAHGLTVDGEVGPQTWAALRGGEPVDPPAPPTPVGPVPHTGNAFIDRISQGAVDAAHRWNIPASVSVAQAILESGWGSSGLARNANNLFGIKGTGPAGSVTVNTQEWVNGQYVTVQAKFRKYHNQAESIEDHAKLLGTSHYYAKARAVASDARAFARALNGIYATAPNYATSLINVMDRYNLYQFDRV